jgi:hypothetical protein
MPYGLQQAPFRINLEQHIPASEAYTGVTQYQSIENPFTQPNWIICKMNPESQLKHIIMSSKTTSKTIQEKINQLLFIKKWSF